MNIHTALRQSVSTLILLIALISFITLPLFASAQATTTAPSTATTTTNTLGDINAQIVALMEKIRLLKQQIIDLTSSIHDVVPGSNSDNANPSTGLDLSHAHACAHFARNLVAGSEGDDVRTLQQMLIGQGLLESDNATGLFGPRTQAALAKFQEKFAVGSSTGTFGPLTRGFLQRWCAKITQPADTTATSTVWQLPPVPSRWMGASTTWPGWNHPTTTATGTNASNSGSNGTNPPIPPMRLQRGMSGEHIKKIQEILAARNDGTFTADHVTGFFGPKTEEALKRFQTNLGIEPLGFVGPQTLQRINEIITTSGLPNPSDNAQLQNAMDQFRQIQQDMSNGSSSNTTFNLEHLRELLGRIQGLRQNIPSSHGQNANTGDNTDWMNGCMPRPACLDATPRCMLPEPAGGWCVASNPQTPSSCGQIQCLIYQPVCGSDGQTYSCGTADANSCGVQVVHSGACQTNSDTNPPVACTMDAMMCPDGSYVGRTGPNCTFVCPTSSGNPPPTNTR